jgi:hypothetical protein
MLLSSVNNLDSIVRANADCGERANRRYLIEIAGLNLPNDFRYGCRDVRRHAADT